VNDGVLTCWSIYYLFMALRDPIIVVVIVLSHGEYGVSMVEKWNA
jgi:hypothetical protein